MDAYTEEVSYGDNTIGLSYDEDMTYEEQVAALPSEEPPNEPSGLKSRISSNKIYLPPESLSKGKRKRGDDMDEAIEEEDEGMDADGLRPNALFLRGSSVSHLPTNNIFAYARTFNVDPVALEWIDDTSCVLIFSTNAACRTALEAFRKTSTEELDADGCMIAKPIPVVIWPAEARINKTLGVAEGLEGPLSVRIARITDKKVPGARNRSIFYQKHGVDAGKDPNAHAIGHASRNSGASGRRGMRFEDEEETRRQLDAELDDFLREDEDDTPSPLPSPPSKMRSDYLTDDGRETKALPGRSLLERTSLMRAHFDNEDVAVRLSSTNGQRRQRGGRGRRHNELSEDSYVLPPSRRRRTENVVERVGPSGRPKKTLQELDDELEAFLNEKN